MRLAIYRLNPQKFKEHYLDIQLDSKAAAWPDEATLLLSFLFNAVDIDELAKEDLGDGYMSRSELDGALGRLIEKQVLIPVKEPETSHRAVATSLSMIRCLYELSHELAAFGDKEVSQAQAGALQTMNQALRELRDSFVKKREKYLAGQTASLNLPASDLKLHFGVPGLRQLKGWVNIEPNPAELACSMKWRLPFKDGAAGWIYSAHTIEHLFFKSEALAFLKEARRVLKPGGYIRVVTPDAEIMGQAYAAKDDELISFRQGLKHYSFTAMYKSRLEHILRYSGGGVRPWDPFIHKYAYDFETMENLFREAGFSSVRKCTYMGSPHAELRIDDQCSAAHQNFNGRYFSLFAEAGK